MQKENCVSGEIANDLLRRCVEVCEERKARDVRLYDVSSSSLLADHYLICTAGSDPHLRAISDNIFKALSEEFGVKPMRLEGIPSSHWIVMDYGDLLVHVMNADTRRYYVIEELWKSGNCVFAGADEDPVYG